jgi:hypothetical protein
VAILPLFSLLSVLSKDWMMSISIVEADHLFSVHQFKC